MEGLVTFRERAGKLESENKSMIKYSALLYSASFIVAPYVKVNINAIILFGSQSEL